jgi:hypothetical protein
LAGRFTGDFDAMLDRRLIRLVGPYSPTLFFADKGTIYATAANGAQLFEQWVNKTFALGARPLTVPLTPVPRDNVFDTLLAGDGDIAAGDITITDELREKVAFSMPFLSNVREIVITREEVAELDSAEALSGKEVVVGRSTSYYESLTKLNERLTAQGKPPVTITIVPDILEVADLMADPQGTEAPPEGSPAGRGRDRLGGPPGQPEVAGDPQWRAHRYHRECKPVVGSDPVLPGQAQANCTPRPRAPTCSAFVTRSRSSDNTPANTGSTPFCWWRKPIRSLDLTSARSRVGAVGLMQLMPKTGRALGDDGCRVIACHCGG